MRKGWNPWEEVEKTSKEIEKPGEAPWRGTIEEALSLVQGGGAFLALLLPPKPLSQNAYPPAWQAPMAWRESSLRGCFQRCFSRVEPLLSAEFWFIPGLP